MERVGAPDAARGGCEGTVRVASWGALRRPSVGNDPILLNLISRGPAATWRPATCAPVATLTDCCRT